MCGLSRDFFVELYMGLVEMSVGEEKLRPYTAIPLKSLLFI